MAVRNVRLFRASNLRGSDYDQLTNKAHIVVSVIDGNVLVMCGDMFHTSRAKPTDYKTTMCQRCMTTKDREDTA